MELFKGKKVKGTRRAGKEKAKKSKKVNTK